MYAALKLKGKIEIKEAFYRRDEKWPLGPEQQQCAKNYMLANNVLSYGL